MVPGLRELEKRCVVPFYLKMMGLNALNSTVQFRALRKVAAKTTDEEVAALLAADWRSRVMGAWFACGRAERVADELLSSLETSAGTLTAPPLAAAAVHGLRERAVPALSAYLRNDLEQGWGSAAFIAAALELLDAAPDDVKVANGDRRNVAGMLTVARTLAAA